jgi:hypothetical protein
MQNLYKRRRKYGEDIEANWDIFRKGVFGDYKL